MNERERRLTEAKRHAMALEEELQKYIDKFPDWELWQFGQDNHYRILLKRLENAEAVVRELERRGE